MCLGIAVALVGLGVASRWWSFVYVNEVTPNRLTVMVDVFGGRLSVRRYTSGTIRPLGFNILTPPRPGRFYWKPRYTTRGGIYVVWIPLWMIVAPLVGIAGITSRLERRRKPGLCEACGYDLRGLGQGSTCPECGA